MGYTQTWQAPRTPLSSTGRREIIITGTPIVLYTRVRYGCVTAKQYCSFKVWIFFKIAQVVSSSIIETAVLVLEMRNTANSDMVHNRNTLRYENRVMGRLVTAIRLCNVIVYMLPKRSVRTPFLSLLVPPIWSCPGGRDMVATVTSYS